MVLQIYTGSRGGKYYIKNNIKQYIKKYMQVLQEGGVLDMCSREQIKLDTNAGINRLFYLPKSKYHLFTNCKNKYKILFTTEGCYSTSNNDSQKISNYIKKHFGTNQLIITDGTSNIGGNVINFGKNFKAVNAVEYNTINYTALVNNIKQYELSNIITIKDDYTKVMTKLKQDIVFLDPPWTGIDYKKINKLDLFLSKKPIYTIINKLKKHARMIVLKVPFNFNYNKFFKNLKYTSNTSNTIYLLELLKYNIIFLIRE
jgi:hypothetical protein